MKNFEEKLEEASDEELYFWVNERDFRVVPLASDELTRRNLIKLKQSIDDSSKNTEIYSRRMLGITLLLFIIAVINIIVTVTTIPLSWLWRIIIMFLIIGLIIYALLSFEKELFIAKRGGKKFEK